MRDVAAATTFYAERLGFTVAHAHEGFARVVRDDCEIHLWQADDESWAERPDLRERAVCSGAESFIAGTASCRIEVDGVESLYAEMTAAAVLHYRDRGAPAHTEWGTQEFHVTDLDNNLLTLFASTTT